MPSFWAARQGSRPQSRLAEIQPAWPVSVSLAQAQESAAAVAFAAVVSAAV